MANRAFWGDFKKRFGLAGQEPATYYRPDVAHFCHLGPSDIGELTPQQLMDAWEFMEEAAGA